MIHPNLAVIQTRIDSLPALPTIVNKVMAITADPECGANDLMRAILPDQSMCTAILKVANSALYGMPRQISTIERAVVVLGHDEIRNIVIGKAILSAFPKFSKEYRLTVDLFWEHAFTCGLAAKIIGQHLGLSQGEAFIAGLIHDIGKLAMLMALPNEYPVLRELSAPGEYGMTNEEESTFGISHDAIGMQLALKWLLPEQLVMAIGYHHAPHAAPEPSPLPLIVQIADILALLYSNPDLLRAEDIEKIFEDFLSDTVDMWLSLNLTWDPRRLGVWFETLKDVRANDQSILDIFAGS
jgi:HD-like signal output (HDOD) protein